MQTANSVSCSATFKYTQLRRSIHKYKPNGLAAQQKTEMYIPDLNRWYDVQFATINWVDGKSVTLCTVYDVTDKKLYQQKIEKQANNDFFDRSV